MISIAKKFLFIHIPKTAGNSLQNILLKYSEDKIVTLAAHQDGVERFEIRNNKYNITKHSTLSHYKSILDPSLYESLYESLYIFSTIRNPWERMISFFFSPHRGVTKWDKDEFLSLLETIQPLRHYIDDANTSSDMHISLDSHLDFLIRFEQLDHDFQIVCNHIGIPYTKLPKRNTSTRQHYSHYYDKELKQLVHDKFIEEIEFGRYLFSYGDS